MKTTIIGRQVRVTDEMKTLFEKKLSKFDKFFQDSAEAYVTLYRTKIHEVTEVTITSNGILYRSEVEDTTFQNALDRVMERIEGQIRKNKTRLEKKLREGAFDRTADEPETEIEEDGEFIIRKKSFSMKPMSVEEAILQMNLLGHTFFVFEDDVTGETNVVYRRKNDEYGLIVSEHE